MSENIIATVNHQKYDHVFKIVFGERKELLSLYNALAGTDYTDPNQLEINTLEDAVYVGMKNDVSFIINDYLNLYEHQSTINPNMPLRGLFYMSDILKTMYYDKLIYSKSRMDILTPTFIVFYNGLNIVPDNFELRLSDSFINKTDTPDLEVVAHVININYGHNTELYDKCQKLKEYAIFVEKIHGALTGVAKEKQAVLLAKVIDECIEEHILEDILGKERKRIMETILSQFDADKYVDGVRKESFDEGFDEGFDKGVKSRQSEINSLKVTLSEKDAENQKLKNLLIANGINPEK